MNAKNRLTCTTTPDGKEHYPPTTTLRLPLYLYYTTFGRALQPEKENNLKNFITQLSQTIPTGRENAVSMRDLAHLLGVNERDVRFLVQKAREQGEPICSDWEQGGYFYPADTFEARRYLRQQKARIRSARAALNGVKRFLQDFAVGDDT